MKNLLPSALKAFYAHKVPWMGSRKRAGTRVDLSLEKATVKTEFFHPSAQSALCAQSTLSELSALFAHGHGLT